MKVVHDLAALQRGTPTILTIGAFDGVHRGHQYLIRSAVDRARALQFESMVLTFDPRPVVTLRPGSTQLTDGIDKTRIIAALGPDVLAILPFTVETSQIPAGQFLGRILDHVNLAEVWVGADFAFGHKREGTVDFLIRSGQSSGFGVHIVARQRFQDGQLSSTRVRELLEEGDVAQAAVLLGHYPGFRGRVVSGFGRGKDLGFPTANIETAESQALPAIGIYAAYLRVNGDRYPAAVSVGTNPTFGGDKLVVEAYLLDFDGDLRDRVVAIDFVDRIRGEQRFDSADELVAEMHRDVDKVRKILDQAVEPGELILTP